MHLDDGEHIVAYARSDFDGMEVIGVERFKPGVCIVTVRYTIIKQMRMMRVFTKDEFVPIREAINVPDL